MSSMIEFSFFRLIRLVLVVLLAVSPVQAQVLPSFKQGADLFMTGSVPVNAAQPLMLQGVMLDSQDPMSFNFIVAGAGDQIVKETQRLAEYFLTSVAISDADLWVNLSPAEPDRIIPQIFGRTEMGKILLEQDAVLKQLTSELMNPESDTGKRFWEKVYEKGAVPVSQGTVPFEDAVQSFNKVWIVPGESVIVQDGSRAFIKSSSLKVMMDSDYLAAATSNEKQVTGTTAEDARYALPAASYQDDVKGIIRDVILPAIEDEVNHGQRFAPLRQVFHSHLLAVWYKNYLQNSLLNRVYADQGKISGIDIDPSFKDQVYQQYLQKFQNGAFNVIREDYDPASQQLVARQYFSGGVLLNKQTGPIFAVTNLPPSEFSAAMLEAGDTVVPFVMREQAGNPAMLEQLDPTKAYVGIAQGTRKKVIIAPKEQADAFVANLFWNVQLSNYQDGGKPSVFELATGSTPKGIYKLWQKQILEFLENHPDLLETFKSFNMDEYALGTDYYDYMEENLFKPLRKYLRPEQTRLLKGFAKDPKAEVESYESEIDSEMEMAKEKNAKTIGIGGVGVEGHVAFNEAVIKILLKALKLMNTRIVKKIRENNYFSIDDFNDLEELKSAIKQVSLIRQNERNRLQYKRRMIQKIRANQREAGQKPYSYQDPAFDALWNKLKQQLQTFYVKGWDQLEVEQKQEIKNYIAELKKELGLEFDIDIFDKDVIITSPSRYIELSFSTITENAIHSRSVDDIKIRAYTMGIGTLMKWDFFVAVAYGVKKNPIMRRILNGQPSEDVPLGQLLDIHPNALVVMDHDAAEGIEFEGEPQEVELKNMNAQEMEQKFENMNNAMLIDNFINDFFKDLNGRKDLQDFLLVSPGQKDAVGALRSQVFPEGLKILVLERSRDKADQYIGGLRRVLPEDTKIQHIDLDKLYRNKEEMSFKRAYRFAPHIVVLPKDDSYALKLADTLASAHGKEGIGLAYYERPLKALEADDIEVESMTAIPIRPNAILRLEESYKDIMLKVVEVFRSQTLRTPYRIMTFFKFIRDALLWKLINPGQSQEDLKYADAVIITKREKGKYVYRKEPYNFVFKDAVNNVKNAIKLTKRSLNVSVFAHFDDFQINAGGWDFMLAHFGIASREINQDSSGSAVSTKDPRLKRRLRIAKKKNPEASDKDLVYIIGSDIRQKEDVRANLELFRDLGYTASYRKQWVTVKGSDLGLDHNRDIKVAEYRIYIEMDGEKQFIRSITPLDINYGENKSLSEGQKAALLARHIKRMINNKYKENLAKFGDGKIDTLVLSTHHFMDRHGSHNAITLRLEAALKLLEEETDFDLYVKVGDLYINSSLSTWRGNEQAYAHFGDEEITEQDWKPTGDDKKDYIKIIQILSALMSSEMTSNGGPGGDTLSMNVLGGWLATRLYRSWTSAESMNLEEAMVHWAIESREFSGREADIILLNVYADELKKSIMQAEESVEKAKVVTFGPGVSEFRHLSEKFNLLGAEFRQDKIDALRKRGIISVGLDIHNSFPFQESSLDGFFGFMVSYLKPRSFFQGLMEKDIKQETYEQLLEEAERTMKNKRVGFLTGKLALKEKDQGYHISSEPDNVGQQGYNYLSKEEVVKGFIDHELIPYIPEEIESSIKYLNQLDPSSGDFYYIYEDKFHGAKFIVRESSEKDPIWIVFFRKETGSSARLNFNQKAEPLPAEVNAASLNAEKTTGGIDLGYGRNIRTRTRDMADDFPDSGDIMRLRRELRGVVPSASGPAVPLKEFLR